MLQHIPNLILLRHDISQAQEDTQFLKECPGYPHIRDWLPSKDVLLSRIGQQSAIARASVFKEMLTQAGWFNLRILSSDYPRAIHTVTPLIAALLEDDQQRFTLRLIPPDKRLGERFSGTPVLSHENESHLIRWQRAREAHGEVPHALTAGQFIPPDRETETALTDRLAQVHAEELARQATDPADATIIAFHSVAGRFYRHYLRTLVNEKQHAAMNNLINNAPFLIRNGYEVGYMHPTDRETDRDITFNKIEFEEQDAKLAEMCR